MTRGRMEARREALRAYLAGAYGDGVVMLDGPEFDGGIVGAAQDGRLVYSCAKLVGALAEANGWSAEEAAEWVGFNTARSLPYMGAHAPVLVDDLDPDDFAPPENTH